jgi:pimeloyl-ACP methyl ester carboxylesterase
MTSDIASVMDATGTERAVLIGLCVDGVWRSIRLAAEHPERVLGIVAFGDRCAAHRAGAGALQDRRRAVR